MSTTKKPYDEIREEAKVLAKENNTPLTVAQTQIANKYGFNHLAALRNKSKQNNGFLIIKSDQATCNFCKKNFKTEIFRNCSLKEDWTRTINICFECCQDPQKENQILYPVPHLLFYKKVSKIFNQYNYKYKMIEIADDIRELKNKNIYELNLTFSKHDSELIENFITNIMENLEGEYLFNLRTVPIESHGYISLVIEFCGFNQAAKTKTYKELKKDKYLNCPSCHGNRSFTVKRNDNNTFTANCTECSKLVDCNEHDTEEKALENIRKWWASDYISINGNTVYRKESNCKYEDGTIILIADKALDNENNIYLVDCETESDNFVLINENDINDIRDLNDFDGKLKLFKRNLHTAF